MRQRLREHFRPGVVFKTPFGSASARSASRS